MSKWTPNAPPPEETSEVARIIADQAKRRRIRAYAMAALPSVIRIYGTNAAAVADAAFNIADAMEYVEHVRNR